jgi:hypothetical protein
LDQKAISLKQQAGTLKELYNGLNQEYQKLSIPTEQTKELSGMDFQDTEQPEEMDTISEPRTFSEKISLQP